MSSWKERWGEKAGKLSQRNSLLQASSHYLLWFFSPCYEEPDNINLKHLLWNTRKIMSYFVLGSHNAEVQTSCQQAEGLPALPTLLLPPPCAFHHAGLWGTRMWCGESTSSGRCHPEPPVKGRLLPVSHPLLSPESWWWTAHKVQGSWEDIVVVCLLHYQCIFIRKVNIDSDCLEQILQQDGIWPCVFPCCWCLIKHKRENSWTKAVGCL